LQRIQKTQLHRLVNKDDHNKIKVVEFRAYPCSGSTDVRTSLQASLCINRSTIAVHAPRHYISHRFLLLLPSTYALNSRSQSNLMSICERFALTCRKSVASQSMGYLVVSDEPTGDVSKIYKNNKKYY